MKIVWSEPAVDDLEVIYRDYRFIYRLERARVVILTVLHGAQDFGGAQPKPWEN